MATNLNSQCLKSPDAKCHIGYKHIEQTICFQERNIMFIYRELTTVVLHCVMSTFLISL